MKLLKLRFANLNSFSSEWQIDFTDDAYKNGGLFAITGPTGAGKSTLLDAICLALYGRTPRLGRISKSQNELMHKKSGWCFAEVTFQCGQGQFCAHWSQHKARKKPDGDLQMARHEISCVSTGILCDTKHKSASDWVAFYTGLDFERFTRSVLLAQGQFALFLHASSDERAPLLEQMTGTEIYSQLSIESHNRKILEQQKYDAIVQRIQQIHCMDEQDMHQLHLQYQVTQQQLAVLKEKQREGQNVLSHVRLRQHVQHSIEKDTAVYESLFKEKSSYQEQLLRLEPEKIQLQKDRDDIHNQWKLMQADWMQMRSLDQDIAHLKKQLQKIQIDLEKTKSDGIHLKQKVAYYVEQLLQYENPEVLQNAVANAQEQLNCVQQQLQAQARIDSLKEHRNHLQPQTPCPLCGSLNHPYVHVAPVSIEDVLQGQKKTFEQHIQQLQQRHTERLLLEKDLKNAEAILETSRELYVTQKHTEQQLHTQVLQATHTRDVQFSNRNALAEEKIFLEQDKVAQNHLNRVLTEWDVVRQKVTQLHAQWEQTGQRLMQLQTQLSAVNKELSVDQDSDVCVLETQLNSVTQQVLQLQKDWGVLEKTLAEQTQLQLQSQDLHTQLQQQQKSCQRWNALHGLIGSADGKKFRVFAQGLTFGVLLDSANRQLQKLCPRYILTQNPQAPLDIFLIDEDQGGVWRSAKNVSGGESFLISLALALGLSQMVGQHLQLDMLFLDEGFGLLDADVLEQALDVLTHLHDDGKMIGLISHVQGLKERIGTHIAVVPLAGGQSCLEGPGVKHNL